ncbi:MAG: glycosyltransferase, partial [Polyangiaceae bacterium]
MAIFGRRGARRLFRIPPGVPPRAVGRSRGNAMKLVDVTEFYSERGGGVRSHLASRGHFLCQLGHDHLVIAPGPRDDATPVLPVPGTARGSTRPRVVRVAGPALPYDRTYHLLGRFDKIRAHVRAERPDVLEAHSPYLATAAVAFCGWSAAPVMTAFWHADHVGTYVEPQLARMLGARAARALSAPLWRGVRSLLAPFDATFVAGRVQAERLRAAGVEGVVHTPFGVDVTTFHPGARSEARRKDLLGGAGPGASILVAVGRFAFEKRWDVVLEAFRRLRSRREAVMVFFGDGPERTALERAAPHGVRFAGFETDRTRLAQALASADVLVHGCPYETFGLGVAEAVACGLPVVVPDAGGAAETVDPSSGQRYRALDAAACSDAIERRLDRAPSELRAHAAGAASRVTTAAD